jgi:hypothetical protein
MSVEFEDDPTPVVDPPERLLQRSTNSAVARLPPTEEVPTLQRPFLPDSELVPLPRPEDLVPTREVTIEATGAATGYQDRAITGPGRALPAAPSGVRITALAVAALAGAGLASLVFLALTC